MEVLFREVPRGKRVVIDEGTDAVSVTANPWSTDSVLSQLTHAHAWNCSMISRASKRVNRYGQVGLVYASPANLILVPRYVDNSSHAEVMPEIAAQLEASESRCLQFTHFSLVKAELPVQQIAAILEWIASNGLASIDRLVIDVDATFVQTAQALWDQFSSNKGFALRHAA